MIHVVKPSWVDACIKTGKAKNPRTFSPDPALFMNDVVVCCGDLPEGDQEAIAGGVIAMGGQFSPQLTKTTTHLIALSIDEDKCQKAVAKRLPLVIVLPHW
jgi:NAD-dependent DNA ligase